MGKKKRKKKIGTSFKATFTFTICKHTDYPGCWFKCVKSFQITPFPSSKFSVNISRLDKNQLLIQLFHYLFTTLS